MATYKVIQDIEAEDKLFGPLTLKQFIYAGITVMLLYLSFFAATRGAGLLIIFFLPPAAFLAILAFPWSREQTTEVWLLAKLRFFFKPRKRVWNSTGIEQLVTITVPKRPEKVYTDNLSQTEVKSRLVALADTIDSRGWAVKNVNVNMFAQPAMGYADTDSDRLINLSALPRQVPTIDIQASEDMLDEENNPTALHLEQMMQASTQNHKQQVQQQMQNARDGNTPGQTPTGQPWFMHPEPQALPGQATFTPLVVAPGAHPAVPAAQTTTPDEEKLLEKIHADEDRPPDDHHKVIHPLSEKRKHHGSDKAKSEKSKKETTRKQEIPQQPSPEKRPPNPAILELANNDDLNVATIARQANKATIRDSQDGVVISLR